MNKPQLENHNLFWDHIGESRQIPQLSMMGFIMHLGCTFMFELSNGSIPTLTPSKVPVWFRMVHSFEEVLGALVNPLLCDS